MGFALQPSSYGFGIWTGYMDIRKFWICRCRHGFLTNNRIGFHRWQRRSGNRTKYVLTSKLAWDWSMGECRRTLIIKLCSKRRFEYGFWFWRDNTFVWSVIRLECYGSWPIAPCDFRPKSSYNYSYDWNLLFARANYRSWLYYLNYRNGCTQWNNTLRKSLGSRSCDDGRNDHDELAFANATCNELEGKFTGVFIWWWRTLHLHTRCYRTG